MKTEHDLLHDALVDLASTVSPNPHRLRQVRQRVARRRRQRIAAGAAVSVGAVAGAFGIAAIPPESGTSRQFNAGGPVLPACASVPAPPPTALPEKTVPQGAKPLEPDLVARYKGTGVVSAVGNGMVTLGQLSKPGVPALVDSAVLVIDATTTIDNNGAPATVSDVVVGQQVWFVASVGTDGRDHLDYLGSGVDAAVNKNAGPIDKSSELVDKTTEPAAPNNETPQGEPAVGSVVKGKAVIEAAPSANELTVSASVGGGDMRSARLLLGSSTKYFRFDTECTGVDLAAGTGILFAAVVNADGSYTATDIRRYE
jgi:hypothetical protein